MDRESPHGCRGAPALGRARLADSPPSDPRPRLRDAGRRGDVAELLAAAKDAGATIRASLIRDAIRCDPEGLRLLAEVELHLEDEG